MALTNIWKNLIENKEEIVDKAKEWVNSHSNNNNSNGYVSVADLRREEYGDTGGGGGGSGTSGNDQRQEQLRQRQEEERRQQQEEEERKQREAEQRAAAERQRIEAEQKRAEEQRLAREAAQRRTAELMAQKNNEAQNNSYQPQTSQPAQNQSQANNNSEQSSSGENNSEQSSSGENVSAPQTTNTPTKSQKPGDFSNLVDLSNGQYGSKSYAGTPNEQNENPFFSAGPQYYEQMNNNGNRSAGQSGSQFSIPTQNYANYVNNSLQRAANASTSKQHEKANEAETAQDLYDRWKNLLQLNESESGNGYVPTNLLRAEDFGTSSQPSANGGTNYQWNGQVRQVDNNTGQIIDRVLVDNPNAAQPHDYYSENPDVRQYTPGTGEYEEANGSHDYFSSNPDVRKFTPGTDEYAVTQETGSPYSQSAIDQAIQFMRGELGIFETDPIAEQQYAEQLIADGVFTPFNENERIAPGIQERNAILSTMADQAGNAIGDTLSGLISGVPEGVSERNDILQEMAEQAGNKITGSIENLVSGVKDRNSIIGNIIDQAGAALESAGENISSGVDERNMLYGQMLDTSLNDLGAGISERNRLVGPVLENVIDRISGGIQQRNNIVSKLLSGEAQPNWNNLKLQPSPDALEGDAELLFPTDFGGTSANPEDYQKEKDDSVGALYNLIADVYNASNSDGWATEQASDLYGTLPAIDPETPGAELLEQQRRDRMAKLIRQIEADDELRDDHPKITGKQVKDAIDQSQNETREFTEGLIDFARDVTEPISTGVKNWAEQDDSKYGKTVQGAQDAALAAGLFPGTAAYENFVNNYVQERTPREVDPSAYNDRANQGMYNYYRGQGYSEDLARRILQNPNESAAIQDAFNNYRASGIDSGLANRLIMEPDKYFVNPETGKVGVRVDRNDIVDYTRRNWDPERFMDDLMLMRAPDINPETGEFNTAAQAIFMGLDPDDPYSQIQKEAGATLTPEQMLHLFDREGAFHNPESGVNSESSFADLLASDSTHAQRNPELAKTLRMTADQYLNKFNDFLNANPIIAMMLQLGLVTAQDIEKNFFNNVELTQGPANGSGNYSGYGSYSKRSSGRDGSYRSYGGGGGGSSSYARRVSANSTPSLSSNGTTQSRSSGYATRSGSLNAYTQPRVNKTPTVKNQQAQRINNIMKNWSF